MQADCGQSTPRRPSESRLKAFGTIVGVGAVLAAAAITMAQHDTSAERGSVPGGTGALIASGNHNSTFDPPNVPGMNMGGTVVSTTPTDVLPVEKAVPQVKAGH
ncbi:hypothetical protein [Mycolicibacterium sp.]|uniref:hypothetical protein n=1 Tax=Mycolicibacterium sp. TaxID=2320850 RepID=UPI0037C9961D